MYYQALVNKKHSYQEEMFLDRELITTKNVCFEEVQVEKETYEAYQKLKACLTEKENIMLGILSSYRGLEEQSQVYDEFVICYGKEYAKEIVAPVGKSEHHTGLCIDLSIQVGGKFLIDNDEIMKNIIKLSRVLRSFIGSFSY